MNYTSVTPVGIPYQSVLPPVNYGCPTCGCCPICGRRNDYYGNNGIWPWSPYRGPTWVNMDGVDSPAVPQPTANNSKSVETKEGHGTYPD